MAKITLKDVEDKIIILRDQRVILDADVAILYGVETKDVNRAVKNNPDKFPEGYIITATIDETENLRLKFLTTKLSPMSRAVPKGFTEKGLYMLATILKSEKATQTTITIIETFAKIRELSRTISELSQSDNEYNHKELLQKGGNIISEILGEDMTTTNTETEFELNFAVLKIKHSIKRKKD